jgi:hypothetical protein
MGPLSAKQHREYLKLNSQEQRESAKMEQDERRKQQLHEIKLQEAAAKANQGIGHKEQMQQVKLKDAGSALSKPPKMNRQKLGLPSTNPLAGTEVFKQGQRKLAQGTDTVPAMLTPGEAIIPEPAAQDPKNKEIIKQMVDEGREANALRDGAVQVVPSLAYEHPDVPGSSFMDGTTQVFSRGSADQANYADGTYGVVPQQVQQAVGYTNGTENVSWLDKLLGGSSSQQAPVTTAPVVVPPVTTQPVYTSNKEIPAVSGVTEPFQQWKNATMGVESSYGNHPKTWEKNNAGAMGLYGLTENTFEGMKKQGMIPKEWKHTDKVQNTQASEVLANDTWKRAGGDPAKASAIWYSGPKAVDSKTGEIKAYKDKLNPDFPNTLQYVDKVKGVLSKSDTQFVPRDIPYNKNAYSMVAGDKGVAQKESNYPDYDLVKPTSIPYTATVTPVVVPAVPPVTQKDRAAFIQKEMDNRSGQMGRDLEASRAKSFEKEIVSQVAPETAPAEVPKVEAPSLIETKPEEANKAIATASQEKADIIKQFVDTAPTVSANPEEQKSWLAKKIESVFSDTGLFSDSELMRFAIVAAGGMLTGGSTGGSLRYAGLDALKAGDARRVQQAEYKKALGLKTEAAGIQRSKDVNKYYDDEINAAEKSGQIKPEYARQLRKAVLSGNLTTVENALGDKENRFATPQFAAGLPADAKVVYVTKPGFTTKEPAYVSPTSNEYVLFKTDSKGNTVVNRVPASQYEQVSSTENIGDQSRNTLFEKQLSPELLARDKNNNPRPGSLHISRQTIVSQLDEWAKEQKRLGLPDNYSYFASTINNALSTAAKNGENKPHVGKLLSMATINTASLTDNDKYLNKDGKAVPSSYIGDTVNSINAYSKSVVDNNKKLTAEEKKDPQAVLRQSKDMMDKAAVKFEAGNKLTPEELADAAVKTGAVKRNDAQYNKIKEAPNSWWSYINYQMAIDKPKKE